MSNILSDELDVVLTFRKLLDKRMVPYEEFPSRGEMFEGIAGERNKLDKLLTKLGYQH